MPRAWLTWTDGWTRVEWQVASADWLRAEIEVSGGDLVSVVSRSAFRALNGVLINLLFWPLKHLHHIISVIKKVKAFHTY